MEKMNEKLRKIPKVDVIVENKVMRELLKENHRPLVIESIQIAINMYREKLLNGGELEKNIEELICEKAKEQLENKKRVSLRKVINGTGILLHTNLGRSVLGERVAEKVKDVAMNYSTLEYNLKKGSRGSRHTHIEKLLCELTGAEAAMAVNNNAGAVMLMLSAIARGKEVIVSRGELVEIGGSFRVPVMMEESGAKLIEVGTTNKTHPKDYEGAIDLEKTGALLKVHASNFAIMGFVKEVSIEELCVIGNKQNIPVLQDLGSGTLYPLETYGLPGEPTIKECLEAGVDVLSFSGDKLLGGPQAGILLGKKKFIEVIKKHPLARILRIDKLTLAALEETLRIYLNPTKISEDIPTIGMLSLKEEQLRKLGERLINEINQGEILGEIELVPSEAQVGGGSVPKGILKSYAVAIKTNTISVDELERRLRSSEIPIITRIHKEQLLLDLRTIFVEDYEYIGKTMRRCLSE
ncbi:MAG: L-seryl-tRNA(Sec) selenium transferase [Eubacteriaceae bacterium]